MAFRTFPNGERSQFGQATLLHLGRYSSPGASSMFYQSPSRALQRSSSSPFFIFSGVVRTFFQFPFDAIYRANAYHDSHVSHREPLLILNEVHRYSKDIKFSWQSTLRLIMYSFVHDFIYLHVCTLCTTCNHLFHRIDFISINHGGRCSSVVAFLEVGFYRQDSELSKGFR